MDNPCGRRTGPGHAPRETTDKGEEQEQLSGSERIDDRGADTFDEIEVLED